MKLKLIVDTLDGLAADVAALYTKRDDGKFALDIDGITDPNSVEKTLKTERDARKAAEKAAQEARESLKEFEGLNAGEAKALLARFANDEELQLLKSGDTTKLREKWTENMRKDYEKKLTTANDTVKAESEKSSKWKGRVLDNAVREAATKVGLHSHAVEDALFRARAMFTLDDNGNAVQIRDGSPVMGKDGTTPYNPAEWLESMREAAPHWFPAGASGSGAPAGKGGGGGNGAKRTIKRSAFDQMAHKERAAYAAEGGVVID